MPVDIRLPIKGLESESNDDAFIFNKDASEREPATDDFAIETQTQKVGLLLPAVQRFTDDAGGDLDPTVLNHEALTICYTEI